jgi:hypothetical protein
MARFTAEGLTYPKACALISALKVNGIDANITAGGVAIHSEPEQVVLAKEICDRCGASFDPGFSTAQENVMLQSADGYQVAEQVTNNARSLLKEWQD